LLQVQGTEVRPTSFCQLPFMTSINRFMSFYVRSF